MPSVRDTPELRRVRDLPRRRLSASDAATWAAVFTDECRLPGSSAALFPWQGMALAEAAANDGAVLGLGVGHGKTLIGELLPVVLRSRNAVLVLPANMRDKTYADRTKIYKDWRAPRTPARLVSREELAPESGAALLEQIAPDLIVIDEADELQNADSAAAKRITRYLVAHPDTRVVVMTGTLVRKSIMNFWHLLGWALRERMPMPSSRAEAREWALALDVARGQNPTRMKPGPLGATAALARAWFKSRLAETPGVVLVDGDSCSAPITIRTRLARECPLLDVAFANFLRTLETPSGEPVSDPLSRFRIDSQMGCGLYLKWKHPPPAEWLGARKAVAAFVRTAIDRSAHSHTPLDTEAQVLRRYAAHPVVMRWRAVQDTFDPVTEAVWLSDSTLQSVRDWLAESAEPGIVWSGCVEFATALTAATRLSYYGPQGRDQFGRGLHAADPTRNLLASWYANKKGFNLQAWSRQLIVMPPQSAKWLEQIFGRSHRTGQDKHVRIDVLATSGGVLDSFEAAIGEAGFGRDIVGMTQKLQRATIVRATPTITKANALRWARKPVPGARSQKTFTVSFGKRLTANAP